MIMYSKVIDTFYIKLNTFVLTGCTVGVMLDKRLQLDARVNFSLGHFPHGYLLIFVQSFMLRLTGKRLSEMKPYCLCYNCMLTYSGTNEHGQ